MLAVSVSGETFAWGRNDKGQLGLGDVINRAEPTRVASLSSLPDGDRVIAASCGKSHSAVATSSGAAWSAGSNAQGQLGVGAPGRRVAKGVEDVRTSFERVSSLLGRQVTKISCGQEFTTWVDGSGAIFTAGSQQYGQCGHGTDGAYNAADSSVKIVYEPLKLPKRIEALADKTITGIASGHNHSIAVASDGGVWTWGFGGYGRLGHKIQQDEHRPRLVETLAGRVTVPPNAVVAAGGTSSFVTVTGGQLYAWGKLKPSGENLMYPTPYLELAGWEIRDMAAGATTFAVAGTLDGTASAITWGHAGGHGELGYGPQGKKSSSNPDKCLALEGTDCFKVAAGIGHTTFLLERNNDVTDALPEFKAKQPEDPDTAPTPGAPAGAGAGKRKAAAGRGGKAAKRR